MRRPAESGDDRHVYPGAVVVLTPVPGGPPVGGLTAAVKRTNINLDMDLVDRAATELGTRRTTDTVHRALRDVIERARRTRLAQRDFEDLTPDAVDGMRSSRTRGA